MPETYFSPLPDVDFHINPKFARPNLPELLPLNPPRGDIAIVEDRLDQLRPYLTEDQFDEVFKDLVVLQYICSAYVLHRVRVIKGKIPLMQYWPTEAGQGRWDKGLPTLDLNFIYKDRLPARDGRPPAIEIERELQDAIKVMVIRITSVIGDRAGVVLDDPGSTTVDLEMALEPILAPIASFFGFDDERRDEPDKTPVVTACINTGNDALKERYGDHTLTIKNAMRREGAGLSPGQLRDFFAREVEQLTAMVDWRLALDEQASALRRRSTSIDKFFSNNPTKLSYDRPALYKSLMTRLVNEESIRRDRMPSLTQMVRIAMTTGVKMAIEGFPSQHYTAPLIYAAAHVGELCHAKGHTSLDTALGAAGLFAVVYNRWNNYTPRIPTDILRCGDYVFDSTRPRNDAERMGWGNEAMSALVELKPTTLSSDAFRRTFVVV